ncbi:MAG: hypothetical protein WC147_07215 [Syntrophomonas sp.]
MVINKISKMNALLVVELADTFASEAEAWQALQDVNSPTQTGRRIDHVKSGKSAGLDVFDINYAVCPAFSLAALGSGLFFYP